MSQFTRIATVQLENGDTYQVFSNGEQYDIRKPHAHTHLLFKPDGSVVAGGTLRVWKEVIDATKSTEPAPTVEDFAGRLLGGVEHMVEEDMSEQVFSTPRYGSSVIRSASHNQRTNKLFVNMHAGTSYVYTGVPRQVYWDLINSRSPGRYFNSQIRGEYPRE